MNPSEREVFRRMILKDADLLGKAVTDDIFPIIKKWILWAFVAGIMIGIVIGGWINS